MLSGLRLQLLQHVSHVVSSKTLCRHTYTFCKCSVSDIVYCLFLAASIDSPPSVEEKPLQESLSEQSVCVADREQSSFHGSAEQSQNDNEIDMMVSNKHQCSSLRSPSWLGVKTCIYSNIAEVGLHSKMFCLN